MGSAASSSRRRKNAPRVVGRRGAGARLPTSAVITSNVERGADIFLLRQRLARGSCRHQPERTPAYRGHRDPDTERVEDPFSAHDGGGEGGSPTREAFAPQEVPSTISMSSTLPPEQQAHARARVVSGAAGTVGSVLRSRDAARSRRRSAGAVEDYRGVPLLFGFRDVHLASASLPGAR